MRNIFTIFTQYVILCRGKSSTRLGGKRYFFPETEAVLAAEVERERRQAVCDTKHFGALRTSMG